MDLENNGRCKRKQKESEEILNIGLQLENIILVANNTTQGFLATFFISVIIGLVYICFNIVSPLGLNDASTGNLKILHVLAAVFGTAMYLTRFYRLMHSGERLWIKVKQSRRVFENRIILSDSIRIRENNSQKSYVLQKRLDVYQYVSPLSPYAVFGLSIKTFYATLATVISYVVILIKLRGVDAADAVMTSHVVNGTGVI